MLDNSECIYCIVVLHLLFGIVASILTTPHESSVSRSPVAQTANGDYIVGAFGSTSSPILRTGVATTRAHFVGRHLQLYWKVKLVKYIHGHQ